MSFTRTPLGSGDYEQVTSDAEGSRMTVTFTHNGETCRSVGNPQQGVPVPADAEVVSVEVA